MLHLKKISLVQFKNYRQQQFLFDKRVIGITGRNGAGKTNLLDAIYYLCFTRSYFTSSESQNTQYQTNGFRLEGDITRNGQSEKIICTVKDGKKEISLNEEKYDRFSRHIGQFPAVMIAPDDADIILGGSEERRKWLDTLLSQLYPDYLEHLITYQKILLQRNTLLKNMPTAGQNPDHLLDVFDLQLVRHGTPVFQTRQHFLTTFIPQVQQLYDYIAGRHEVVNIRYQCTLQEADFAAQLQQARFKDMQVQRTTAGIHRDDLLFLLDDHLMKTSASQGQRKSFLFALKLAQFEVIRQHKQFPPLLLLDDIFEKLDQDRVNRLITLVTGDTYGQVFITDTHADRLLQAFAATSETIRLIEV
ncbi:DNA replication/repair protein RecF [Chitinophaga nivalis]|uniref:DNA replication and repair protein RecF n=1 Tax=Chitinophaga nivalis TaxID=2991709 RepID=A0ABT3IL54_9BACT|nr:DNA replication and repair protein RecF [Chitinophaga nivalis]MCW3465617.1 DNA replication and repair protein RecF [Chitinophaga nivalis]MCW3484692.1 DNA replication and repair protein RecF [Chitinophaga nivalis]